MGAQENKSRSEYKNSNLPVPADQKWTDTFLDAVVLWAGGQLGIWSIPDETLTAALQKIFAAVYPDLQYEVMVTGAVFGMVCHALNFFFLSAHSSSLKHK